MEQQKTKKKKIKYARDWGEWVCIFFLYVLCVYVRFKAYQQCVGAVLFVMDFSQTPRVILTCALKINLCTHRVCEILKLWLLAMYSRCWCCCYFSRYEITNVCWLFRLLASFNWNKPLFSIVGSCMWCHCLTVCMCNFFF